MRKLSKEQLHDKDSVHVTHMYIVKGYRYLPISTLCSSVKNKYYPVFTLSAQWLDQWSRYSSVFMLLLSHNESVFQFFVVCFVTRTFSYMDYRTFAMQYVKACRSQLLTQQLNDFIQPYIICIYIPLMKLQLESHLSQYTYVLNLVEHQIAIL